MGRILEKNNYSFNVFNIHIETEYYDIISKWWKGRDWALNPIKNLSTTGVMVFYKNMPICAGWLYQTDSSMSLLGSIISSLDRGKMKAKALKVLFGEIEKISKNLGFESIFFPVTTNSLARFAEKRMNYVNTGEKANELLKFYGSGISTNR